MVDEGVLADQSGVFCIGLGEHHRPDFAISSPEAATGRDRRTHQTYSHQSGHKAGVAGVYNRARYADEMRTALQKWGDHIDRLT